MNKPNEPVKNQTTDEKKKGATPMDQPSKDQSSKDQSSKQQSSKDQFSNEQSSKEQPSREQAFKNTSPEDMSAAQKEQDKRPTDNSRDTTGLEKNSFNNDGAPVNPGNKQEMKGGAGNQAGTGDQAKQPTGGADKNSANKSMNKDSSDKGENMGSGRRQDDN